MEMRPADCPQKWEYRDFPNGASILQNRCAAIIVSIRRGSVPECAIAGDTRSMHRKMFEGLTPPECDYFAGNYRGDPFKCLRHLKVGVAGDSAVGVAPEKVLSDLREFAQAVKLGLQKHEAALALPNAQISSQDKFLYYVSFVCVTLCEFLRIHPYANGNGHISRFIVWWLLGKYGHWPKKWPLDQRPAPPYTELLSRHRQGDCLPLEMYVLRCIAG